MKPFTWDQRIARARSLAVDSPTRELLEFYVQIAQLQKKIGDCLKDIEHCEIERVLPFAAPLSSLLHALGSPELGHALSELREDRERWAELLLEYWQRQPGSASPARALIAYSLLQPYAQHVTSRMNIAAADTSADCPVCGNAPLVSLLRQYGDGGKRSLCCFLCSTEWEFKRTICVNCGEQNKDKLPVFTAEQIEQARVEACDSCRTYIKAIDLTKDGNAVPEVDDLATLALDFWAQEQHYSRVQPNVFLLAVWSEASA